MEGFFEDSFGGGSVASDARDVDHYVSIAGCLKKDAFSKTVTELGYAPVSFQWENSFKRPASAARGKVETLRAVVPSANQAAATARAHSRPQSAPHGRKAPREVDIDERMRELGLVDTFAPKPARRKQPPPPDKAARPPSAGVGGRHLKPLPKEPPPVQPPPKKPKAVVDGVQYVYDVHGRLVPQGDQFKATEELRQRRATLTSFKSQQELLALADTKSSRVFDPDCDLIQKTREWAKKTHEWKVSERQKGERTQWAPMKLPWSTFPPEDDAEVPPLSPANQLLDSR